MWRLRRNRALRDDPLEEEDLRGALPAGPAAQVQGAGFRGWKEVTSLFNKDDEQHLLEKCQPPKMREASLRLKEELKAAQKQQARGAPAKLSAPPASPDDGAEGWGEAAPGREDAEKGPAKGSGLAGAGGRWALRSAGRLVSIRRQGPGARRESWKELE